MTNHQQEQKKIINTIEKQIQTNSLNLSVVTPVKNFDEDKRICLTSVHFPDKVVLSQIQNQIIKPLQLLERDQYFYTPESFHITIKNIRVVNDPPHFDEKEALQTSKIFSAIVPTHKKFNVYFDRLLLFPNNLSLVGTTDPEMDALILDLDQALKKAGIYDDKILVNTKYFLATMTLARFTHPYNDQFRITVSSISDNLTLKPYTIDSVSLVSGNAVLKNPHIYGKWLLR
jgi:2'-5' RNA ligase